MERSFPKIILNQVFEWLPIAIIGGLLVAFLPGGLAISGSSLKKR